MFILLDVYSMQGPDYPPRQFEDNPNGHSKSKPMWIIFGKLMILQILISFSSLKLSDKGVSTF